MLRSAALFVYPLRGGRGCKFLEWTRYLDNEVKRTPVCSGRRTDRIGAIPAPQEA